MANYVFLGKLTHQGIVGIKEVSKRFDAFKNLIEKKGGKLLAEYATFGRFDYVIVVDLPDDQAALEVTVKTGIKGNVTFETCRAFPFKEFVEAIEKT